MATIGIFDSGSGGLSVLKEILRILPGENYIYYSDNAFCPYGGRSNEYIIDRSTIIVKELLSKGAQAIVVACNTATGAAIKTLRSDWPEIPFIGMEPAVKPAVAISKTKVVGVLATESTLHSPKYIETKRRYSEGVKIVEHCGKGFVELVEKGQTSGPNAEMIVKESLKPLLAQGADTIVLGCTHYPFLLPVLQKIAGNNVLFIDPAPAVAKHLREVLSQKGISLDKKEKPRIEIESSGSSETARRLLNDILLSLNLS